jgi:ADP-ribose pyrophosphatase YjhB (NUDIX family)
MDANPKWLDWANKLQFIAQAGLAYSNNPHDLLRFQEIRDLSVDIMDHYTEAGVGKLKELFAGGKGYQTPKVDARAAIFKGNELLFIKEKVDGLWSLPGGWCDVDCSVKETVIKESKEEAGAVVRPKRLIAVHDSRKRNKPPWLYTIYKFFVECDYVSGDFKPNIETLDAGFFKLDNLPPLSVTRNTREQVEMCFEVRGKDTHEPYFD